MGRPAKNTAEEVAAVETAATIDNAENMEMKENNVAPAKEAKAAATSKVVEPLNDADEIEVVSLIPNVSYKDNRSGDFYQWDEVGHTEYMTFETLKNMWRNCKGYFRNMWLKPMDNRVISKFGLTSVFEKYEFLMEAKNYTRANISKICENISATPNGMKQSICKKIKDLIVNGELADVMVIRALENHLKLDLISLLK